MTQEEKSILLKDLSARLSYGVKVEIDGYYTHVLKGIDGSTISTDRGINYPLKLVKPYLRKLSSMTEEEQFQLGKLLGATSYNLLKGEYSSLKELLEYVYKNHIDLFGLIPMGLALETTEDMYK